MNPNLLTVADIVTLQTKGRPDANQIMVTGQGIYNWSASGTVDGLSTVAANLGGFWVRQISTGTTHQTLTEASTINWDISKGNIADLTINTNSSIQLNILNATPWSFGTLLVKHHLAASTLVLPGKLLTGFAWAVNQDGYTELNYSYDGTTFRWASGVADTVPVYGPYTTAFAAYLSGLGINLSIGQKTALSTFETAMTTAGLIGSGINKCMAIYPIVGGVASTHVVNFLNPANTDAAFRGIINGTVTNSATGILPVTNGYMDTRWAPTNAGNTFGEHVSIYLRQNVQTGVSIGANAGVIQNLGAGFGPLIIARDTNSNFTVQMQLNGAGIITTANASSQGLFTGSAISPGSMRAYKNGILQGSIAEASGGLGLPTNFVWLGAADGTGAFPQNEFCYASVGQSFTDADALAEYNACQALQTALSRNV